MVECQSILLVDDDPNDVLLLQRAFRKEHLTNPMYVVSDGESAMAYLAGDGIYGDRDLYPMPVLVLLDLKLPRASGHDVLAWIRRQPGLGRIRVTVLTSSKEESDVNRAFELGANAYLVKPVDMAELRRIVRSIVTFWLQLGERPEL